ncbi:MAG: phytanoyl-CoA dioxygenase family protein [Pseudomonadota bacterium]
MALSATQLQQFQKDGYLVVPSVVPRDLCQAVIGEIVDYCGVDLDVEDTWYNRRYAGHGIVPLHHGQAMWDLRQYPAVYEVFRVLYGRDDLWVSMDRVSYKPPVSERSKDWSEAGVHWDADPWSNNGLGIQGLVYLTDTAEDQGAFCCVPDIYRGLDEYRLEHERDEHRLRPVYDRSMIKAVGGPAGSLVVFNRLMPHSSLLNQSASHRFVQYVAMTTAGVDAAREQRVKEWQDKMPPAWAIRQQVPGQEIPEPGDRACLSALGRKLVGVDRW